MNLSSPEFSLNRSVGQRSIMPEARYLVNGRGNGNLTSRNEQGLYLFRFEIIIYAAD